MLTGESKRRSIGNQIAFWKRLVVAVVAVAVVVSDAVVVLVEATISITSVRNPSLSGLYVRGVEFLDRKDDVKGPYYALAGEEEGFWLYRTTIEKDDNNSILYRWLIGETIFRDDSLAFVDVTSIGGIYDDEPPCQRNGEGNSNDATAWMVAEEGSWHPDSSFSVSCHGMEPGGIDACPHDDNNHGEFVVPCVPLPGRASGHGGPNNDWEAAPVWMPLVMLGTAYISEHHGAGRDNPEVIEPPPAIELALEIGYQGLDLGSQRHPAYANERLVGGLLQQLPGRRQSLFLTTKLSPSEHGYHSTLKAVQRSLRLLQTDTIDLYMIHHPSCLMVQTCEGDWTQSWKAMELLFLSGAFRSVGVSNFNAHLLDHLLTHVRTTTTTPAAIIPVAAIQNRADPLAQEQPDLLEMCRNHGIHYQTFSVLGRQWVVGPWSPYWRGSHQNHPILDHPHVVAIAQRLSSSSSETETTSYSVVTPAQVVLRWALNKGWSVIPKTASAERLESNRQLFHFNLTEADMQIIDQLEPPPTNTHDEL